MGKFSSVDATDSVDATYSIPKTAVCSNILVKVTTVLYKCKTKINKTIPQRIPIHVSHKGFDLGELNGDILLSSMDTAIRQI